jgi:hypothetical protein
MTHGNDWPSTESGMSIFAKEVRFVYLLLFFNTNFSVAKLVRFAAPF